MNCFQIKRIKHLKGLNPNTGALTLLLIVNFLHSQINLIPTGTGAVMDIPSVIGKNVMVCGHKDYLQKSYDECDNLIPLSVPGAPGNTNFYQRLDSNLLFAFSANFSAYDFKIFKSTDDGQSWNKIFDSIGGVFFTHFAFFDANEGVVIGTFGRMTRTINGGNTWTKESVPLTLASAIRPHGDSILTIGVGDSGVGVVFTSATRGKTWINGKGDNMGGKSQPLNINYLSKDTIFATGTFGEAGVPFTRSYDGGKNWKVTVISPAPNIKPNGICPRSRNEVYVAGNTLGTIGIILKTKDLGETWSVFNTGIQSELTDMKFINDSIALVSGTNGVLFKWNSRTAVFQNITTLSELNKNYYNISLFPNPASDLQTISIVCEPFSKVSVEVFDLLGRKVKQVPLTQNTANHLTIGHDLSDLSPSVYLYVIRINDDVVCRKFVRE